MAKTLETIVGVIGPMRIGLALNNQTPMRGIAFDFIVWIDADTTRQIELIMPEGSIDVFAETFAEQVRLMRAETKQ